MSDSNSVPTIGITTYLQRAQTGVWDNIAAYLPHQYFSMYSELGATVVLLPPQSPSSTRISSIMRQINGLIVVGGHDINPQYYGQEMHHKTDPPGHVRDEWELALTEAAMKFDKPLLGICRGAQIMNVASGGTLVQHLPDLLGHDEYQLGQGRFNWIEIKTLPNSLIHKIIGESSNVAMYHHQSIKDIGLGLKVTAHTREGVIQAIECPNMTFGVGVQWHPEEDESDIRLFEALYDQALMDLRKQDMRTNETYVS